MDSGKARRERAVGGYMVKLARVESKALDGEHIQAVLSTETRDRDGDIIRAAGWDLKRFREHPILLSSHNYGSLTAQIGDWEDVKVRNKQLIGVARYYVGLGNEEADWGYQLASRGKAAYSVGFIPDMAKAKELKDEEDDDGWWPNYEFNGQELLECSHVTVPSNPEALQSIKSVKLHPAIREVVDDLLREASSDQVAASIAAGAVVKSPEMMDRMTECMGKMGEAMGMMDDMAGDMGSQKSPDLMPQMRQARGYLRKSMAAMQGMMGDMEMDDDEGMDDGEGEKGATTVETKKEPASDERLQDPEHEFVRRFLAAAQLGWR